MSTYQLPRLILGDNQFFGINHMSEEKARAQALHFQDIRAVYDVVDAAQAEGIHTFMCTTHDRVATICDHVRRHPQRYRSFDFYPSMPYAHKYANAAAEDGMLGAIKRFTPEGGLLTAAFRGGMSLATRDIEGLATLLIDAEMKMFQGLSTPVIFLQNVVVDLLLGLGMHHAFRIFADHVRRRYRAEPGFLTMNLPRLLDALDEVGVLNPIVCTNLNKLGFRMCGGVEAYDRALRERRFRPIAMSVFASGAIPAREAIEWVCERPNLDSIVFGASTRANIQSTRELVDHFWPASVEIDLATGIGHWPLTNVPVNEAQVRREAVGP
jgi:hypothetical protein